MEETRKLILYTEETDGKTCGIELYNGLKKNIEPLTLQMIQEYFDIGYEIVYQGLSITIQTGIDKALRRVTF